MPRHRPYRPFSTRPHTYGVRPWSCPAIATEPCRPTACVHERPCPHNGQGGRGETPSYRASAPAGADVSPAIVHCSFYIVHCTTFTFSAKERDSETGLSYFGSRYYSSDLSLWLSVDPQSDKYASLSPYTYCANNPVKLVDPNGEAIGDPPMHHHFLITVGIQIYSAARKEGASPNGAILVLAHACLESSWGRKAEQFKEYNLFGIMGKPSKRNTTHGSVKDYSSLGGYEASINDYFKRTKDKWPKWGNVLSQNDFTSDDIDKALNTGSCYPSKDDQKNGKYAYCGDLDENGASHYGETLMEVFSSAKKRFITSLDYQINQNEEKIRKGTPYSKGYLDRLEKENTKFRKILDEIK